VTTAPDFVTPTPPRPEVQRDRWDRPLVLDPTGKRTAYTRCTTFVSAIEDTFNLSRWAQRKVAYGLSLRPDLARQVAELSAAEETADTKAALNVLLDKAKRAGGGDDAAAMGTYMHKVTEAADLGYDPAEVPMPELAFPRQREEFTADLDAYVEATAPLRTRMVEAFSVLDHLKVAGTPDRVVEYQGKRYIADLKTGSINLGALKIAAQLAVYSRSRPYDVATDERTEHHGASHEWGIVVHLPLGTGTCTLHWVDLTTGWRAAMLCGEVRRARSSHKARTLYNDLTPEPGGDPDIGHLIGRCTTADQVRALWRDHADRWTPELTDRAKAHIASLAR
jgi:hypothetical protein